MPRYRGIAGLFLSLQIGTGFAKNIEYQFDSFAPYRDDPPPGFTC